MRTRELIFEAADGRTLAATAWEPARVLGAVVVASATGVPRRIYAPLAAYLAEAGLVVLTFDYRGIGGSLDRPLRSDPTRMEDWGRLDLEAALGWMRREHPGFRWWCSVTAPGVSSSVWRPRPGTSPGHSPSGRSWAGRGTGPGLRAG